MNGKQPNETTNSLKAIVLNPNMLKEIAQGVLSLSILILVAMLYFSNFNLNFLAHSVFNLNAQRQNLVIGYLSFEKQNIINQSNCQFNLPQQKTVILRLDDVQAWTWNKISINLTQTILEKNMSVTLAVIPKNIEKNEVMKSYLLSVVNNSHVEIAQHGTNHTVEEFQNTSYNETYSLVWDGLEKIENTLDVRPVTFIPPYNEYNENVPPILSQFGFKILSAKPQEYKFDGNINHVGFDIKTKANKNYDLNPISEDITACKIALQQKNLCVVLMHPQDFVANDKVSMNETRYGNFTQLLDGLSNLNATSITFKDLVTCS